VNRDRIRTFWLADRGAIAVEFAWIFPVLMLIIFGIFEMGELILDQMQISYVAQGAAQLGALSTPAGPDRGLAWARPLLPSVTFSGSTAACGVVITGQLPVDFGILGVLSLSQSACWPIPPTSPSTTP
jgi:Flp pilus assembly protein TadG